MAGCLVLMKGIQDEVEEEKPVLITMTYNTTLTPHGYV